MRNGWAFWISIGDCIPGCTFSGCSSTWQELAASLRPACLGLSPLLGRPHSSFLDNLKGWPSKEQTLVCLIIPLKFLLAWTLFAAQASGVNTAQHQSSITIHVYKTGLFSAFAHNHVIVAPVNRQTVDPKKMSVEVVVLTRDIKVTDPEASESTRSEVQTTMLGPKVLDMEKYPEVHFKSSRVEQTSPGHYRVTGTLELHGAIKEISLEVSGASDHYHGSTRLKQTEYGIQPVSIGGGTVKVRDQIDLDFDIYPGESANAIQH
jgi:YceI-like domain